MEGEESLESVPLSKLETPLLASALRVLLQEGAGYRLIALVGMGASQEANRRARRLDRTRIGRCLGNGGNGLPSALEGLQQRTRPCGVPNFDESTGPPICDGPRGPGGCHFS